MNNTSLTTADRGTHLKIVAVSLVAAIVVAAVAIAARSTLADAGMPGARAATQATGPVIRAGKPVAFSAGGLSEIY
jgi:hypothetical protein